MKRERRKVQITGRATYVVSLPKWWVREVGLRQGDEIELFPRYDGSLVLSFGRVKEEKLRAFIDGIRYEGEEVGRLIIGRYVGGYDILKIRFHPATVREVKRIIKEKLVGVEIIEETTGELVAQCLLGHVELPLKTALSRMGVLSLTMYRDVMKALEAQDRLLAEDVASRDDEVDRLYFFIARQLNMAITYRNMLEEMGLRRPSECMEYRLVAKSLERVADHAVRIARAISGLDSPIEPEFKERVVEVGMLSNAICENAINAFLKEDGKLAQKAISQAEEVGGLEERLVTMLFSRRLDPVTASNLRLIIESIRRVGEYGADVAEATVNLETLPSE